MPILVLSQTEVRELLPMDRCIELMAEALTGLSAGEAVNPLRHGIFLPDRSGLLGLMPGYTAEPAALGVKVIAVFPDNHGSELDSHQGIVALFDAQNGCPLAILEASEITAIRTAAASGLATRLLAREDASELAILGSGRQARAHLEAMAAVRPLNKVRVFSPHREHREGFAAKARRRSSLLVRAVDSAEEAVRGADIICTTTTSADPVVHGSWIHPGAHINAAGSSVASDRELDTASVLRARLFVDCRESTVNEAGDFLIPKKEGAVTDEHIQGELGEILLGRIQGRQSADEVTLFKSLGVAVEDLAAATYVYTEAKDRGVGTEVELGGTRS